MSNKNRNKAKKNDKSTLAFVLEILGILGGIVGPLMAIYAFVKTFRDDVDGFTWLLALGGAIWLIVIWRMFRKHKAYAYVFVAVTLLGGVTAWVGWRGNVQARQDQLIIVLAAFDGPEETYGLRNQILEELTTRQNYQDLLQILPVDEVISSVQGRKAAIELGRKHQADIVIWAWYRPTENPNLNLHFENLSTEEFNVVKDSENYQPSASLSALESFELQKQIGSEINNLILFLRGYIYFNLDDDEQAAKYFEQVIDNSDFIPLVGQENIYLLAGYAHTNMGNLEAAKKEFEKVIELAPNSSYGYNGRGTIYMGLDDYQNAMNDFNKAIELNPNSIKDYLNLGGLYHYSGRNDLALREMEKAIQLDPDYGGSYEARGALYNSMGMYDKAILDFKRALKLNSESGEAYDGLGFAYDGLKNDDLALKYYGIAIEKSPKYFPAYENRANLYHRLNKEDLAIKDYSQVLALRPRAAVYNNRGVAYAESGLYQQALDDYNTGLTLSPDMAMLYYNRALVYQKMGKAAEADADFTKYKELTGKDSP